MPSTRQVKRRLALGAGFILGLLTLVALACNDDPGEPGPEDNILWGAYYAYPGGCITAEDYPIALDVVSKNEIWLAGSRGGYGLRVFRYLNGAWTDWDLGYFIMGGYALEALSPADVRVLTGNGYEQTYIYRFDGNEWNIETDMEGGPGGMDFWDATHGMAVSAADAGEDDGVYIYDGVQWTLTPSECHGRELVMVSPTAAFIADNGGDIYRFENGVVDVQRIPVLGILDLEMVSPTSGWACCGDFGLYHYDGSAWKRVEDFPGTHPYSAAFINETKGWILAVYNDPRAGAAPCVWRYEDGRYYPERVEAVLVGGAQTPAPLPGNAPPVIRMYEDGGGYILDCDGFWERLH